MEKRLHQKKLLRQLIEFKKEIDRNKDVSVPTSVRRDFEGFSNKQKRVLDDTVSNVCNSQSLRSLSHVESEIAEKKIKLKDLDNEISESSKIEKDLKSNVKNTKAEFSNQEKEIIKNEIIVKELYNEVNEHEKENIQQKQTYQEKHNCNLFMYSMYKKFTGLKVSCDESTKVVTLQFFPNCYIKLHSDDLKTNWRLIDIQPEVIDRMTLEQELIKTDDVQALAAHVHSAFERVNKNS